MMEQYANKRTERFGTDKRWEWQQHDFKPFFSTKRVTHSVTKSPRSPLISTELRQNGWVCLPSNVSTEWKFLPAARDGFFFLSWTIVAIVGAGDTACEKLIGLSKLSQK
jgi:thioredoxin reductase